MHEVIVFLVSLLYQISFCDSGIIGLLIPKFVSFELLSQMFTLVLTISSNVMFIMWDHKMRMIYMILNFIKTINPQSCEIVFE